jgi:arylsulfatase A-like enzyme
VKSRYFLHLAALSSFALAAPLFAKLGPAPGYFAAHGLTSLEVVLLAVALVVVPPVLLFIPELIVVKRRPRWLVHLVLVAALAALIFLPPFGGLDSPWAYIVAGLLGVAFAALYARFRNVRLFTTWLAPAPVLFLAWFLLVSPTAKFVAGDQSDAWKADDSFRPPIVFIQFDALPSLLLETPGRQVDAHRYPNIARLSRDGVWYRNASNVHENTVFSVPSFVDGRLPHKGTRPVVQDHNPNLFTVLGPTYRMNVAEEATTLCPYDFCGQQPSNGSLWKDTRVVFNQIIRPENQREDLPSISDRWTDFDAGPLKTNFRTRKKTPAFVIRHLQSGRIGRYERWLARVGLGGAHPQLDYIHMFLPHEPREFIPDGRHYKSPDPALEGPPAYDNRYLSEMEEQRTQLQLGYTDRVVGQVMSRLKRLGIYDDALIVVVADHGESFLPPKATPAGPFVPGHLGYRRAVTRRNIEDIASIPMFIKYPNGHGPAGIDDRYVRAPDVFPTIVGRLGVGLQPLDGRDLFSPGYHGYGSVRVATTFDGVVRMSRSRWQRARDLSLRRRLRLFGSGKRSLYDWGAHRSLLGHPVADFEFSPTPTTPVHATVDGAARFKNVNPVSPVCLCQLAGRIQGANPIGMPLAIAVNGRIVATAEGFKTRGAKKLNWAAMIPPGAYHDGANTIQILRIAGPRRLEAIGGAT